MNKIKYYSILAFLIINSCFAGEQFSVELGVSYYPNSTFWTPCMPFKLKNIGNYLGITTKLYNKDNFISELTITYGLHLTQKQSTSSFYSDYSNNPQQYYFATNQIYLGYKFNISKVVTLIAKGGFGTMFEQLETASVFCSGFESSPLISYSTTLKHKITNLLYGIQISNEYLLPLHNIEDCHFKMGLILFI